MIIYDQKSGEIVLSTPTELPDEAIAKNLEMYPGAGCLRAESIDRPSEHFVTHDGEVRQKPPRPDGDHVWRGRQWELDSDLKTRSVLRQRNALLAQSDWTQLPDVPLATKQVWADYRQALRDITKQADFPLSVVLPVAPSN